MSKCYIQLAGGIGNVIQTVPFIYECRKYYDEVYGVYTRQDFTANLFNAIFPLIKDLFDDIFDMYPAKDGVYYSTPIEQPARSTFTTWDEPEHAKWFTVHNIPKPSIYNTTLNWNSNLNTGHDVILWAGCKPIWKSKRWHHWANLTLQMAHLNIGVVGLPGEGNFTITKNMTDYRGKISLEDTAYLIGNSAWYVGNEGGVSHLAAATGARTYIIYGASDPVKNTPPHRKGLYRIALNLPCQPCQFTPDRGFTAGEGCPELNCLKDLTARIVYSYINKSLEHYSRI